MGSVGLPQFDVEELSTVGPSIDSVEGRPPHVPLVVGFLLCAAAIGIVALLGRGEAKTAAPAAIAASPAPVTPEVAPQNEDSGTESVEDAADTDTVTSQDELKLTGLGSGVVAARDPLEETSSLASFYATADGFARIERPGDGSPNLVLSTAGTVWASRLPISSIGLDEDLRVATIRVAPDGRSGVLIFRGADRFAFSSGAEPTVSISAPAGATIEDLAVGSATAYATIAEPTVDGGRYTVLRISLGEELTVAEVDLDSELGGDRDLNRLRDGVVLSDGRVVAIASDRGNTVSALVEFGPDGTREIELEERSTLSLRRTTALHARGNDLVAIDRVGAVHLKRLKEAWFSEAELPVHPSNTASHNGVLASVEVLPGKTLVHVWEREGETSKQIVLGARIEPIDLVAINTSEALLSTTTSSGERWLIGVPFVP